MQAKNSAGNDCPRLPRVAGRNLTATAGNLREAFRASLTWKSQGRFFQTQGRFLLTSSKQFDQSNHLPPLKSMVNTSNLILFQKKLDCSLLAFQSAVQKHTRHWKVLHYRQIVEKITIGNQNWFGNELIDFAVFWLDYAWFFRFHICIDWNLQKLLNCNWFFDVIKAVR